MRSARNIPALVAFAACVGTSVGARDAAAAAPNCFLELCYATADGTPALGEGSEAWIFPWHTSKDRNAIFHIEAYDGGALAVATGPFPGGCIEIGEPGPELVDFTNIVWTKVRGFKPVLTYDVPCDRWGPPRQIVVEPETPEAEAEQMCPVPPPTGCPVTGVIQDPEGNALVTPLYVFSSGAWPQGEVWLEPNLATSGAYTFLDGHIEWVAPGTVLFFAPGYLPKMGCLPCGDYTIQLERQTYRYDPDRGCSVDPGARSDSPGALLLLLLAVLSLARGIRRKRG